MSSTIPTIQSPSAKVSPDLGREGTGKTPRPQSSLKNQYLILYNLVSLILWSSILLRGLSAALFSADSKNDILKSRVFESTSSSQIGSIYTTIGDATKWIQTLALAEVVHALVGLVRAPVLTTAMQVASRFLLVWGVVSLFGSRMLVGLAGFESNGIQWNQLAYFTMLMAWSLTECIRYAYFVFFLAGSGVPEILTWLRYNTFFVLYPLGITSECYMIYKALPYARQLDTRYAWFLMGCLGIYVPGSYVLYTHMMSQRRRIMKGKQKNRTH